MSEFKWADGFDNGALRDQLVFLKKFNINPNKFVYQLDDDSLDLNIDYFKYYNIMFY